MRTPSLGTILIAILSVFAAMPLSAENPGSSGDFTIETLGSIGYDGDGASVSGYYRLPVGAVFGVTARALLPNTFLNPDPVTGLTDNFQIYGYSSAEAGWEFLLPLGFVLSARLFAGVEISYLTERIVDVAHGMDRSRTDWGALFDSGLSLSASWMFVDWMGACLSLRISFDDIRKSAALLGLRFGLSGASL